MVAGMTKEAIKPKKKMVLPKYLSIKELKALISAPYKTNQHHVLMMKYGCKCGLRNAEICNVKSSDHNFTDHNMIVLGIDHSFLWWGGGRIGGKIPPDKYV